MEKTEYYLIVDVESDTYNKWHRMVKGKRCTIESLELGEMAWFMIEKLSPYYEFTRFHTSLVNGVQYEEDTGELVIKTENSVYTLRRIENG